MGFEVRTKRDSTTALSGILDLFKTMDALGDKYEEDHAQKRLYLSNQLANVQDTTQLESLTPLIQKYNQESQNLGFDEYSLKIPFDNKKDLFNDADRILDQAKYYKSENQRDPDALYDKIMGMSWQQAFNEQSTLDTNVAELQGAIDNGYRPKDVSTDSLKKAMQHRQNILQNKMVIWEENEGQWLVPDPLNKTGFDEQSQFIYNDLKFKVLSGRTADFEQDFDGYVNNVTQKLATTEEMYKNNRYYLALTAQKDKTFAELNNEVENDDSLNAGYKALLKENISSKASTAYVPSSFYGELEQLIGERGKQYARQFELLNGQPYAKQYVWDILDPFDELPDNVFGNVRNLPVGDKTQQLTPDEIAALEKEKRLKEEEEKKKQEEEGGETIEVEVPAGEGFPYGEVIGPGVGFGVYTGRKQIAKGLTNAYEASKKWFRSSRNLTGRQITQIVNSDALQKNQNFINKTTKQLEELGDLVTSEEYKKRIKDGMSPEEKLKIQKNNKKIRKLSHELKLSKKHTSNIVKNAAGFKVSKKDVDLILNNKKNWSIFNLKRKFLDKYPTAAKEWVTQTLKKDPIRIAKGITKGVGQYRVASGISEGLQKFIGKDFGTAGDIVTEAAILATPVAIKKTAQKFWPKLRKLVVTKKGRDFLVKKLGRASAIKLGKAFGMGGGWLSWATTFFGLGLLAKDVRNLVRDMPDEVLEAIEEEPIEETEE